MPKLETVSYKVLFCGLCTVLLALAVYCYQTDQKNLNSNYERLEKKVDKVIVLISDGKKDTDVELGKLDGDISELRIKDKEHDKDIEYIKADLKERL